MSGCIYNYTRWILGGMFIYAGSAKLLEPKAFTVLIEAFGIVPESLLMPVAVGLPLLEVVAGLGLLFDIRGSLALMTGLLVLFMVVLGYGIWMGLDVDCGCFGPEDPETEAFHGLRLSLFRDLAMMAGVSFIYGRRRYRAIRPAGVMDIVNQLFSKRKKEDAYG
ncbi:MAG: MauE/DoxX family redox-associated membrane protein [Desulfobacterales bacterium]